MCDFVLRGIGLTTVAVVVLMTLFRVVCGRGALNCGVLFIYRIAPLLILGFCCTFFWHAFESTRVHVCDNQVFVEDIRNAHGNLPQLLLDKERIVRKEHEAFRAELGTWLAVFGLLSILATIMVPVATHKFQAMAAEDERRKNARLVANIRSEVEGLQCRIEGIKYDMLFRQAGLCLETVNMGPSAGLFRRGVGFLSTILHSSRLTDVDKGMSTLNLLSRFYGHYGSLKPAEKREYVDAMRSFKWRFTMADVERILAKGTEQEKKDYQVQYECACGAILKMREEFGKCS